MITNMQQITSLTMGPKKKMNVALYYILGIIGVGLIVVLGGETIRGVFELKDSAALNVETPYFPGAAVLVDGVSLGQTPLSNAKVKPGTHQITIKTDSRQYVTSANFLPKDGYIYSVGIVRDLGVSDTFSSGQDLWFDKEGSGNVLRVISDPSGATVLIDGAADGTTPYSSSKITEGSHELQIDKPGYESQKAQVNIKHSNLLNVSFKLLPTPVPSPVALLLGSQNIYNLSSQNSVLLSDTQEWAKGVAYWIKTRGILVSGAQLTNDWKFDLLVDYKGNLFDPQGGAVSSIALTTNPVIGYLGNVADGAGMSTQAVAALKNTGFGLGKQIVIKASTTGWVRVRSLPSLTGAELTRVNDGSKYSVIEEKTGWVKIQVTDTLSGWVSTDYTEASN